MRRFQLPFACLFGAVSVAGCNEKVPLSTPARPVTFVTLETIDPSASTRWTGTAESWKREELAFEVSGRVARILEPGENILGRTYDEEGTPLTDGTILAELDDQRYQIALESAQAGADASRTELEQVIPQQLKEAQAKQELDERQLARYRAIRAENPGAASQADIDRFEAAVKASTAQVATVEALRATKAAELNTFLAQIDQAQRDIRDCQLVSPFTGQIARAHIIPGGYAFRGIPVMTVQMMDPIKVDIAVSPQTDERINFNDILHVYTPSGEQLDGYVYLKDTFADPTTRTFVVTILARNKRFEQGVPDDLRDKSIPRCSNLWTAQRTEGQTTGNYYVPVNALRQDDQGYYVWKAENLTIDQLSGKFSPVVTVRRVRVTPGEGRVPVLQIYTFRELVDTGGLDPLQDVVVGGVTGDVEDGGQVVLSRKRWALRPGDVVRVGLPGDETPAGFYVPELAIQQDGDSHYVLVAKPSGATHTASRVDVHLYETLEQMQRIEAVGDGQLQEGAMVIVEGAHYVVDGEEVRTIEQVAVNR